MAKTATIITNSVKTPARKAVFAKFLSVPKKQTLHAHRLELDVNKKMVVP